MTNKKYMTVLISMIILAVLLGLIGGSLCIYCFFKCVKIILNKLQQQNSPSQLSERDSLLNSVKTPTDNNDDS